MTAQLPIFEIQNQVSAQLQKAPLVVTAPTGSGKSTELPRWLSAFGKVLVIEPRRVACLGLCERVSFLERSDVGKKVGYHVRGQSRFEADTRILFVTPGIALKYFAAGLLAQFDAVVLDEFHERGIETDLLLALLKKKYTGFLVVTSATISAAPLAEYLNGIALTARGTLYDVHVQYMGPKEALPSDDRLSERVCAAVEKAMAYPGDILVFLPGKAEIRHVAEALCRFSDVTVVQMHGDLGLGDQERVFASTPSRKVVLATNVCETSITVPGIGVVIDSGLVKRTRFVDDRGFLTLMPIAMDSAKQRAGRAGRTSDGVCFRLWSARAVLDTYTPAEMFRESLTQMVLAAASCGVSINELDFYEAPKPYAVQAALQSLTALGALDDAQHITSRGRAMFGLPLRAEMAAFLVDADQAGLLCEAIDVVSVAETPRDLFFSAQRPKVPGDDFRLAGCDIRAAISAMTTPLRETKRFALNPVALADAQKLRRELREAFGVPLSCESDAHQAPQLAALFIRTHERSAYVARRKRGQLFFSNGDGKEITLSQSSAVPDEKVEAMVVFSTVAMGLGYREKDARIVATMASPVTRAQLAAAQLGQLVVSRPQVVAGRVVANVSRELAGCVLTTSEEIPTGEGAISAIAELFLNGRIFQETRTESEKRLAEAAVMKSVRQYHLCDDLLEMGEWEGMVPSFDEWTLQTLRTLGIESGDDLSLLTADDLLAPMLPEWTAEWVRQRFPLFVNLGDAQYDVKYDFANRTVTLYKVGGTRKGPPSLNTVPAFTGFKIKVKHHTQTWVLRG